MNETRRGGAIDRTAWALLCAFVFSLPWEKGVFVPTVGSISRALGMLALAAGIAAAVRRPSVRFPNLAMFPAAAFVAWVFVTRTWSIAPQATALRMATFAQLLAMLCLIWDQCRTAQQQTQLMGAYVLGTVPSAVATGVRFLLNQQTYWRRYATAGFDPNDLGLTLALSLPLALYLAFRTQGRTQWVWRACAALSIWAITLTASRTALIASIVSFAFAALTWRGSTHAQRVSSFALLAFLLMSTVRFAPAASRERLATLPDELSRGNLHNRTRIWKTGLKALKQHPILGVGSGAYAEAVRPWLGRPSIPGHEFVAHNTFLSVLVETGPVGFSLFALLLAVLTVFIWMMRPPEAALWAVTLAVWTFGVFTLTWEQRKPTWLLFALLMTCWRLAFDGRGART